jgi:hypothetical protein
MGMRCKRCGKDNQRKGWFCAECEAQYDAWSRQHATDIMWVVLGGGVVLAASGMILPFLGFEWFVAAAGALAGWGTILVSSKLNAQRRRKQFLSGAALPRAYLPAPK